MSCSFLQIVFLSVRHLQRHLFTHYGFSSAKNTPTNSNISYGIIASPAFQTQSFSCFSYLVLCEHSLDSLHYVYVSLTMGSPELDTALQVWPCQC